MRDGNRLSSRTLPLSPLPLPASYHRRQVRTGSTRRRTNEPIWAGNKVRPCHKFADSNTTLYCGTSMKSAANMMQQNNCRKSLLLLAPTITMLLWTSSALTLATSTKPAVNNSLSFDQIPGLYAHDDLITPIQGQHQFEMLVLGAHSHEIEVVREHQMSLVQFYMATCPDCQGFSPYFKRFVKNIAPHWRRLMRVFVVNCNDDLNINLCWYKGSLVVPTVRWFTLPAIIDALPQSNGSTAGNLYPVNLVSDSHRRVIEKQRRDLISLRHATLGFMSANINQLEDLSEESIPSKKHDKREKLSSFYRALRPIHWRHLQSLGRPTAHKQAEPDFSNSVQNRFKLELQARQLECRQLIGGPKSRETMIDFIVFERASSYLGKTLVADWSNHSCSSETNKLFMVHYSNQLDLLGPSGSNLSEPQLYSIETKPIQFELERVTTSGQLNMRRRRRWAQQLLEQANQSGSSSQQRLLQRMSLEQYYSKRRPGPTNHRHPAYKDTHVAKRRMKRLTGQDDPEKAKNKAQMEAENINWAPQELYRNEELLSSIFNRAIAHKVLAANADFQQQVAGWTAGDFGEIKMAPKDQQQVVAPKDEDLSLVSLTDYYKVLDQILHKNLYQRPQVDGYQFLGATCFIDQLSRHFPFQGGSRPGHRSRAQNFLEMLERGYIGHLGKILNIDGSSRQEIVDLSKVCSAALSFEETTLSKMSAMNMSVEVLQDMDKKVKFHHQLSVPDEGHFKWAYCAGSSPYLRGHTCSLWLLFHTLTVHEYLESNNTMIRDLEYKFVSPGDSEYSIQSVNQSSAGRPQCEPNQPEAAFLGTSSRDLFIKAPQFALANIINFVRYFMSCTNCAAHFSCMVERSMDKLDFERPNPGDHLLFLWEVHNRVNLRTRNTHSEDPRHPKHVFPSYDACPYCYLEKPSAEQVNLDSLKFNKEELIKFLVARYRRSAILNNKIHIEDLSRIKPTQTTPSPSPK